MENLIQGFGAVVSVGCWEKEGFGVIMPDLGGFHRVDFGIGGVFCFVEHFVAAFPDSVGIFLECS